MVNQRKLIGSPEIGLHIYGQLIFNKDETIVHYRERKRKKTSLFNKQYQNNLIYDKKKTMIISSNHTEKLEMGHRPKYKS